MILHINYWHRTEAGEASNLIKVNEPTEVAAHRKAQQEFFAKCNAYASDPSVIDYSVTILDPKSGRVGLHHEYFTPDAPADEPLMPD